MDILTSNKQGHQSVIVDRIGYDKEGHTVYTKLGNGTETTYTYDKQRERLQVMNLTWMVRLQYIWQQLYAIVRQGGKFQR
ncbi:hypothetical protein [Prevotella histicola]